MLARELMNTPAITIREDATLRDAAALLIEKKISGLPIVDDAGDLVGILTSTDFAPRETNVPGTDVRAIQLFQRWLGPGGVEQAYREAAATPLRDVMTTNPVIAHEDDPVAKIARLMLDHNINHVPIVREKTPVGIITRHDYLRMLTRAPDGDERNRS